MEGNLLTAHGGGPTAVINGSLQGVVEEAKNHTSIKGIYGARYGIEGVLSEDFVDFGKESAANIRGLSATPASALGSCRRKIIKEDYPIILDIFKKYNIRYFLYNGGNDSMDTCNKVSKIAIEYNYDIKVIGIPKTIDNDLDLTDHCPGFGSAARFIAVSAMELAHEVKALPIHVVVMETMGRNAGWLTAAAALAKRGGNLGPHLIYLPEIPLNEDEFLEDVKACYDKFRGVLVVVSEGLLDMKGNPIADTGIIDGFGHKIPGGTAQALSTMIIKKLGLRSRSEKPGLLGRCSISLQSSVDIDEALRVGRFAVKSAMEGKTGYMVSIKRTNDKPYQSELKLVPLNKVANHEKKFPRDWINKRGNGIKQEFIDYCMPLLGEPLPCYVTLDGVLADKK